MNLKEQMERRLQGQEPGWVFTPSDFLDLGTPQAVGMALLRLARAGEIQRLDRGLYLLPKVHPVLGPLHPRPEAVLAALTRRDGTEFQEHESYSANRLRLTEQVPARHIYLTSGRSRVIQAGPLTIELRHRSARKLDAPAPMSARVFAALRNLGKNHVTPEGLKPLSTLLSDEDRRRLLADLTKAPVWMHPHIRTIVNPQRPAS